jgi:hypothetical protein
MRQPAVPYLEPLAAAAWWTVGAAALDAGTGTVLLAGGLGLTAALLVFLRRRHGSGARLRSGERGSLLRTLGITAALAAVTGTVLGFFGIGELAVPVICALVGVAAISLARVLAARSLLLAGGALLVLAATGALLALDSAGRLYPQGMVGMVAAGVLWLSGAYRGGLLTAPPRLPRRRRYVDPEARTEPRRPARRGDTRRLPLPGEQGRWER